MESFIESSLIVSDPDEYSSFEIDETRTDDPILLNESTKSSERGSLSNATNTKTLDGERKRAGNDQHESMQNVNVSVQNYRSSPKDSSDDSSTEPDTIVLSSDDGDNPQTENDSSGVKATSININSSSNEATNSNIDSSSHEQSSTSVDAESSDVSAGGESKYTEVTQAVYDAHVAKIDDTTDRIHNYEGLLKLSAQLPDKGQKLKQLVVKLQSDLDEMRTTFKSLKIKEPNELAVDFQNLSLNESENVTASESSNVTASENELSYEDDDSIANLFREIKRSEKSMPGNDDLADQPGLINGTLMRHQQQALAWMIWRENQSNPKGGILGDDMGLGKTLSMISLIARHIQMSGSKSQKEQRADDSTEYNGGTLVVCPASVIRQWEDEINRFTNYSLSVCLHHGDKRSNYADDLTSYDVLITTYGIVRSEVEKNGALAQIRWERIVLDEAHTIRNHNSKQSLTCCRLQGTRKWALTGTPIQNKHGDVFALIKFLGCSPLTDFNLWTRWTKKKPEQKISSLLKFLLLRRTKNELGKIGEINSLPEKTLTIVPVQLTPDEKMVYETVASFSKILSEKFRHQRDPNYNLQSSKNSLPRDDIQKALDFFKISGSISSSHILLVILRLRQICIHSNLIDAMLMEEDFQDISAESNMLEELSEMTIDNEKLHRSNPVFDADRPSSKFDAILNTIMTKVIDRQEKAVVVSQFTSVLRLFEDHLSRKDVKFLVLNGSTKISHRQNIVRSFNEDPDEQILLLSLTAGGVGLNLCGANNLFFIDPHWNPQLESQAEDRVYRIGQTKPVTIYRFICEGTIEERIQNLQQRKKGVAKNILKGFKLNIDDMMALI